MLSARDSDGRYPLSGKEYSALLSLFAVNSTLNDQANVLTERIKTKSGAWRDFRLATVKMQKVLDEIVTTIPVKKLHAIARDLQHARVHVDINTASERRYNGVIYVDESALIALLDYAVSQNCWCCEKKNKDVKHCQILKLITDVMPYDQDPSHNPADGSCQGQPRFEDVSHHDGHEQDRADEL